MGKKNKVSGNSKLKRKVRIEMSIELDVFLERGGKDADEEQLGKIASVYKSCFGDKDIKIEDIKFLN